MNTIGKIKAITFDTGGTILDWHTGFLNAFKKIGKKLLLKCLVKL